MGGSRSDQAPLSARFPWGCVMAFFGPTDPADDRVACEPCDGTGELGDEPCDACRATGAITEDEYESLQRLGLEQDDLAYLMLLARTFRIAPLKSVEERSITEALEDACARLNVDIADVLRLHDESNDLSWAVQL